MDSPSPSVTGDLAPAVCFLKPPRSGLRLFFTLTIMTRIPFRFFPYLSIPVSRPRSWLVCSIIWQQSKTWCGGSAIDHLTDLAVSTLPFFQVARCGCFSFSHEACNEWRAWGFSRQAAWRFDDVQIFRSFWTLLSSYGRGRWTWVHDYSEASSCDIDNDNGSVGGC